MTGFAAATFRRAAEVLAAGAGAVLLAGDGAVLLAGAAVVPGAGVTVALVVAVPALVVSIGVVLTSTFAARLPVLAAGVAVVTEAVCGPDATFTTTVDGPPDPLLPQAHNPTDVAAKNSSKRTLAIWVCNTRLSVAERVCRDVIEM
jgi:hypothetical protein